MLKRKNRWQDVSGKSTDKIGEAVNEDARNRLQIQLWRRVATERMEWRGLLKEGRAQLGL